MGRALSLVLLLALFGVSDGDLQMFQWTCLNDRPHFCLVVHHTDGDREWAYDRQSSVGRLDHALDEAQQRGWSVANKRLETGFSK